MGQCIETLKKSLNYWCVFYLIVLSISLLGYSLLSYWEALSTALLAFAISLLLVIIKPKALGLKWVSLVLNCLGAGIGISFYYSASGLTLGESKWVILGFLILASLYSLFVGSKWFNGQANRRGLVIGFILSFMSLLVWIFFSDNGLWSILTLSFVIFTAFLKSVDIHMNRKNVFSVFELVKTASDRMALGVF